MPELPDVERYRRFFVEHAARRVIRDVTADPTILRNSTPRLLRSALRRRTFDEPERHGKWLICWTDGPALMLHFGMTGTLIWSDDESGRHPWDRLVLLFQGGGELRYRNMRKLGGAWLAHGPGDVASILGRLGPDALSLSAPQIVNLLDQRRGQAKAALMDQSVMAGIGNLLADEILWQAHVHPKRRLDSLDRDGKRRLASSVRSVVARTAAAGDGAMVRGRWLMPVRGGPGAVCPRCGTPLARTVAAGRTTWFCPTCQADPGDRRDRSRNADGRGSR